MKKKKTKIVNSLKLGILLFGISLLLWNCEKESETIPQSQPSISLKKVKKQFYASFNREAFSTLPSPQWENAKVFYDTTGNPYLEIPFQTINSQDIEKGTSVSFDRLIAFSKGNTIALNVIHYFGTDIANNYVDFKEISHTELYNFSGFVSTYDLNKNVIDIKRYNNGIDINQKLSIKDKSKNEDLFAKVNEDTWEYTETTCTRGCWYWEYESGRIEVISCSAWSCTTTTYTGSRSSGGSGNGGGTSTSYNTHKETKCTDGYTRNTDSDGKCVKIPPQIFNELTGKADCVYKKLEGNDLRNKTIKRFDGDSTPENLVIKLGDISNSNVAGETDYGIGTDTVTITLDNDYMDNSPSLFAALTILHEAIHADIYRKIKTTSGIYYNSATSRWELPNGSEANFPTLFDYYDNYPINPHHNYMADYYRSAIDQGLKDYASSNGLSFSNQLYKDLAWAGLQGTNAWNNMYADPVFNKNEQNRIKNDIQNFIKSGNNECY